MLPLGGRPQGHLRIQQRACILDAAVVKNKSCQMHTWWTLRPLWGCFSFYEPSGKSTLAISFCLNVSLHQTDLHNVWATGRLFAVLFCFERPKYFSPECAYSNISECVSRCYQQLDMSHVSYVISGHLLKTRRHGCHAMRKTKFFHQEEAREQRIFLWLQGNPKSIAHTNLWSCGIEFKRLENLIKNWIYLFYLKFCV